MSSNDQIVPQKPLPDWIGIHDDDDEYSIRRTVSFEYDGYTYSISVVRDMEPAARAVIVTVINTIRNIEFARRYARALTEAVRIADELNAIQGLGGGYGYAPNPAPQPAPDGIAASLRSVEDAVREVSVEMTYLRNRRRITFNQFFMMETLFKCELSACPTVAAIRETAATWTAKLEALKAVGNV